MFAQSKRSEGERKYRRAEASEYLKTEHDLDYTPGTLAKLATVGGGPAFFAGPRFPLYPKSELDKWAWQKLGPLVSSTSEAPAKARKPPLQPREPVAA